MTGVTVTDLYQILGVKRGAARKDIHKAYRRKAKTSHPDVGGSVAAFNEVVTAYAVLSDAKRRARYDETGEIEPPRPDNSDGAALEVIAQKLGLIIHAEQDVTSMDVVALIEQTIIEDIAERKASIAHHERAAERVVRLRTRARRKEHTNDNLLARVLDWHGLSIKNHIKKSENLVSSMERALEILKDYAFADEMASATPEDVSDTLVDILAALDQLAVVLNTSYPGAEAFPRGAAPGACG
ncbi:MAG: DnaJ domain-containing protein [Methyloceanibacter sp.]